MRLLPKSLRNRLFLLLFIVAGIPIVLSGYSIARTAVDAMVAEKQQKLFGAARMLDQHLTGTYVDILQRHEAQNLSREAKISLLNSELAQFTDAVSQAYPGIGVGYYNRDLDAIITYGPSNIYADKVGLPIGNSHEGRIVMATGVPRIQEGDLVRGQIMNAMHPLVRGQTVIGYVWANELTVDIRAQLNSILWQIGWTILACLIVGSIGVIFVVGRLAADVEDITCGLRKMRESLAYRIAQPHSEVGEIATAINDMAQALEAKQRLEERVQRADRLALIGEMAAGLAHEIRNPLMAIKGFAQLQDENTTLQEHQEYNDIITREVDRMNHLIEQLLYFSRPSPALQTDVQINDILKNTLMLVEMRSRFTSVVFDIDLSPVLPAITANEEQLEQVFLNIIINALQAMDNDGKLCISSRYSAVLQQVRVDITDTGPGIAAENLPKLFDPFFTTKETGTGLGLAVAHHLMSVWNGSIAVNSTVGAGSTFTLIFPAVRSDENVDKTVT